MHISSSWIRRVLLLSVGITSTGLSAQSVRAQISLRPSNDASAIVQDYQGSSRRSVHVSREANSTASPLTSELTTHASLSPRDAEYQLLQQEADALDRQLNLVRRIVKFASPSVVHIEATKKADSGKGFASSRVEEAGAGVIVAIMGRPYVLTNRHVIYPADLDAIRIELNDGQILRPVRVWTDPSTDVAVMQLNRDELVPARVGDSDRLDIGDFVLAVGSPFGLSHSVTYGILSAKGRRNLELGSKEIEIQDFFQTDAAINPGNSGGPLLNLRGEVIGINTAIASNSGGNEGIGFSIPMNMAITVAEQLVTRGKLLRSYLGVQLENSFDSLTAQRLGLSSAKGALVKAIIPNSPAERAGVRVGDVILEFHGRKIENDAHLVKTVGLTPAGTHADLVIFREGKSQRLRARLDPSPDQQ
jgi:serine protease Do